MHCEEPLRLVDLWNLRARGEADDRRTEQFAGGLMAAECLVEICKRQCSAQLEGSRLLTAGDLDGTHESCFRGSGVRPGQFQEKLAANPVHLGLEPAFSGLLDGGELRIHRRQSV